MHTRRSGAEMGSVMLVPDLDVESPWSVVAPRASHTSIIVIGAGGTGSRFVHSFVQTVCEFNRDEDNIAEKRRVSLLIVDYDRVAEKNVRARQNFCPAEIGFPKAQVLANRYRIAFSLGKDEVSALVKPFSRDIVSRHGGGLTILVGCVDNAAARAEIASCLTNNRNYEVPRYWYIDAGNGSDWGQVFVGNTATLEELQGCLHEPICSRLPSPALLAPSMYEVPHEETAVTEIKRFVCGELTMDGQEGNRQGRTINTSMAALLFAYVERLLYGSLTTFATWTNLSLFQTHSESVTSSALANALGKPASFASFFTMAPDDEPEERREGEDEEGWDEDEGV